MDPVSVESSPRYTRRPCPGAPGAPRKTRDQTPESLILDLDLALDLSSPSVSLSPRILLPSFQLDEYDGSLSPISLFSQSRSQSIATEPATELASESVGDCGVCYSQLPLRANHVFTICGHLFCVTCFVTWCDTSTTCPMCRAALVNRSVSVPGPVSVPVPGPDSELGVDDAIDDDDSDVDADVVAEANALLVPLIDQYLHLDTHLADQWSTSEYTNPDDDDEISGLTEDELELMRYNRIVATAVFLRNRFTETLSSESNWGCDVIHTAIPKSTWKMLWENPMTYLCDNGPAHMFEFVLRRYGAHTRGVETNLFGYVSNAVLVSTENDVVSMENADADADEDDRDDWENTTEYALVIDVFCPSAPFGHYDLNAGLIITTQLTLRFSHIRRMYYVTSIES